jgi:Domain of unknown function (DUF222)/HNH endonuclease
VVHVLPEEVDLGAYLVALRHTIDKLELDFARVALDFVRDHHDGVDGYNTAYDWLRFNCHMTSNTVSSAAWVGEHESRLGESVEAMREGEIGYAHVATLAKTANSVGKAFDESKLLPLALKSSPGKFFRECEHYRHSVDAGGYNREQQELAEGRSLRLSTAQDGCLLISGVFDPVAGAEVRNALEPLAKPSGKHDYRNCEQRMADAFYERVTAGKPAHLQVTATIETLKGLAGAAGGEMEFSVPVSSAAIQRIACDCAVTRVLLDQDSLIIDVGRATQKIPVALRKALRLRDRHCRWPGCERPASWCDGHHMLHWIKGGPTDLDNVVLLCKRHHRMVHEGGWQLVKVAGELVPIAPTITFGLPRGPD